MSKSENIYDEMGHILDNVTGVCALCGWVSPRLPMKAPQHIVDAAAKGAKIKNLILIAKDCTLLDDLEYGVACKLLEVISCSKANDFCQFFMTGDVHNDKWKIVSRNRAEVEAFVHDSDSYVIRVP